MTPSLLSKLEEFAKKWAPPGRTKEFLSDLGALIKDCVIDATSYMVAGK